MIVEQPQVSVAEFQAMVIRVNELEQQIGLLVSALEQVIEAMSGQIMAEFVDSPLGDHPDVCPEMIEMLQIQQLKN